MSPTKSACIRTVEKSKEELIELILVADCLQSTIKLVRAKYRETAKFVLDFAIDPHIMYWPAHLNQVFMNLLVNACHAILERQQKQPQLKGLINIYDEADHVIISIGDNGNGMDDKAKATLFEPFLPLKTLARAQALVYRFHLVLLKNIRAI